MTGDVDPATLHVPALRLDEEVELLRAEVARLTTTQHEPAVRRVNQLGPWRTERVDDVRPGRAHATGRRLTAAADLVVALRAAGAFALAVAGVAVLLIVLTVLYGLWRLAARFAAWAADGSLLVGGVVMLVALPALVLAAAWLFLRATGRDR